MASWQVSQLKFALGFSSIFTLYGIVGIVVYMLPAGTASYNTKIALIVVILLTLPFTLLVGWLVARRSKKKQEKKAA